MAEILETGCIKDAPASPNERRAFAGTRESSRFARRRNRDRGDNRACGISRYRNISPARRRISRMKADARNRISRSERFHFVSPPSIRSSFSSRVAPFSRHVIFVRGFGLENPELLIARSDAPFANVLTFKCPNRANASRDTSGFPFKPPRALVFAPGLRSIKRKIRLIQSRPRSWPNRRHANRKRAEIPVESSRRSRRADNALLACARGKIPDGRSLSRRILRLLWERARSFAASTDPLAILAFYHLGA